MTKKQLAAWVVGRLEEAYPLADCTLDFGSAWQLLVAVRLAAQCTDARVNIVTEELFARYGSPAALAEAGPEAIEAIVRPCGLGRSKARDIAASMAIVNERYGGLVPDNMEELLALPGVGRKSANLILGDVYKKPAIVTDTHCIRISNRLGLADSQNPAVVEKQLRGVVAPEKGNDLCHRFVLHGRAVCTARRAACERCCLAEHCASSFL